MTERIYYTDSYLVEFSSIVHSIAEVDGRWRVILKLSAFYPTSGGQLHDRGAIAGIPVQDVFDENGEVIHIIEKKPDFAIGDEVACRIDWPWRHHNMQRHTGQHILSQAFLRSCKAETISAYLGESDNTLDLTCEEIGDEDIVEAEDMANEIIYANGPVKIDFVPDDKLKDVPLRKIPDRDGRTYRIVTVADFDWSACGGTHCARTGEVGIVKITGREKIRGKIRLHFLTGKAALEDYRWRFDQIEKISNAFTRHGRESFEAVVALKSDHDELKKSVTALKKKLLPMSIAGWMAEAKSIGGDPVIAIDLSDEDFNEAKEAALGIIHSHKAIALIACKDKFIAAVHKEISISASDIIKRASARFGGRGGGSPELAQGGGFRPEDLKVLLVQPEKVLDI